MAGSVVRDSHMEGDTRVWDPCCSRCVPQVVGAAADLLRVAATLLEAEAKTVADNTLAINADIIWGGNFHAEPIALLLKS